MVRKLSMFWVALLLVGCAQSENLQGTDVPPVDIVDASGDSTDASEPPAERVVDLVDPFIGTGGHAFRAGSAFVGAMAPFGMVQVGPDSRSDAWPAPWDHCSGYNYDDDELRAFSHTHLHGTGIASLGAVGFFPVAGAMDDRLVAGNRTATLDKASEEAHPGYYAVTLSDVGVRAELTAATRGAVHRYQRADGSAGPLTLLVDVSHAIDGGAILDGGVAIDPTADGAVAWAHSRDSFTVGFDGVAVHHALRFADRPSDYGTWTDGALTDGDTTQTGPTSGMWFTWDLAAGEAVEIQVGLSYVDAAGATANLEAEVARRSFDTVRAETEQAWEDELSVVRFEGGRPEERVIMATSLYHAFLMPTTFTDVDGRYRGLDGEIHMANGFVYYTNFSLWDTYRTLHPLLILLRPDRQRDMLRSLVRMADEGGYVPKWPLTSGYTNCMVGTGADVVAGGSVAKGITDFDAESLYASLKLTATTPTGDHAYVGREGVAEYMSLGYVPVEAAHGSVARTLEFAIGDYGLSTMAAELGYADDAEAFATRAQNYRNVWDEDRQYFFPRHADGSFEEDIDPLDMNMAVGAYTEGSALQYRWLVPHDGPALVALFDSPEAFVAELEDFFENAVAAEAALQERMQTDPRWWLGLPAPYYWHGNEPDIHAAYLFSEAGRPDLTQRWLATIRETWYSTAPDGVPGNDDAGTLGAWYVFSALGFYPIAGGDRYWLGAPLFPRVVLELGDRELSIEAPEAGQGRPYVTAVTLDGVPREGTTILHDELVSATTLRFEMAAAP